MKEKLSFFTKVELIITHPHKFFEKIKNEKIKDIFEFLFLFVFLINLVNLIFKMPQLVKDNMTLVPLKFILFIIIFTVFFLMLLPGPLIPPRLALPGYSCAVL